MLSHHPFYFITLMSVLLWPQASMTMPASERLQFEAYTNQDGLSLNLVSVVLQDTRGFMWFATHDGLNRFDGSDFHVFRKEFDNPNSLVSQMIWALIEDKDGNLWIGTAGGLSRLDPDTGQFTNYVHNPNDSRSISDNDVRSLLLGSDGRIWVGTRSGGLNLLNPTSGKFSRFMHDPDNSTSISNNRVNALIQDQKGYIWVGTYGGLDRFDPRQGGFSHFNDMLGSKEPIYERIRSLLEDSEGFLWVGSYGKGLYRINPERTRYDHFLANPQASESLSDGFIFSLLEDHQKNVWVGTRQGLNRWDGLQFTTWNADTTDPQGLKSDVCLSLYRDRDNLLWIGTFEGGVAKVNTATLLFGHHRHNPKNPNSLHNPFVVNMTEASPDEFWIAHAEGLDRWDRNANRFTYYPLITEDNPQRAFDVAFDPEGVLWAATTQGLFSHDPKTDRFNYRILGMPDSNQNQPQTVVSLLNDNHGGFWIGTSTFGLIHRRGVDTTIYRHDPDNPDTSFTSGALFSINDDHDSGVWIGSSAGLSHFQNQSNSFTHWQHEEGNPNSLAENNITTVTRDRRGRVWVGTSLAGFHLFDPQTNHFKRYNEADGLINNAVYKILEDPRGYLWISTNQGLSKFDPEKGNFENYDRFDGLQNGDFAINAGLVTSERHMLFGGADGFNYFDPLAIKFETSPPPVYLTEFRKFNRPVDLGRTLYSMDKLDLTYKDAVFSISFRALDYIDPNGTRYAYKMEGFDQDWTYTDNMRMAVYTNMDPGDYTFRAKGANRRGVWNETGAAVNISIEPPPWKTWWAILIYVVVLIGGIYIYIRSHKKKLAHERKTNDQLRQVSRLKDEFFANTSHELRTPLNGIIGLTESLLEGAAGPVEDSVRSNLAIISTSARRLSTLVSDILDFSKLKNKSINLELKPVDITSVTDMVLALSKSLAKDKNLELINDLDPDGLMVFADENRLYQIMYNLVGNAVKFTESGQVKISGQVNDDTLEVQVSDTGIGIRKEMYQRIFESFEQVDGSTTRLYGGTGLGLAITKSLLTLHGGSIWVESKVGQGSTFIFTLPVYTGADSQPTAQTSDSHIAKVHGDMDFDGDTLTAYEIKPAEGAFNILIVDDEPVNRQVLINQLSLEKHYAVTQVPNGMEALEILESGQKFDLILLDVMMPKISGYEVCRKIRDKFPASELPIILLTAKDRVEDLVTGFESGANDYLTKPTTKNELVARLATHLELLSSTRRLEEYNLELESKVVERTRRLEEAQKKLLEAAHQKGRAESAINVLHNIGNTLNSVTVSANLIHEHIKDPRATRILTGVANMLKQHEQDLGAFFTNDDRARAIPDGLTKISAKLEKTQAVLEQEVAQLVDAVTRANKTLRAQREHAAAGTDYEEVDVDILVRDTLKSMNREIEHRNIQLSSVYGNLPVLQVHKKKLNSVMEHLLANAIDALDTNSNGRLSVRTRLSEDWASIEIADNGQGIDPENLDRIFHDGFTTRDDRGGFGLHSCANAMTEMQGRIRVQSEGIGRGAVFILDIPRNREELSAMDVDQPS